jgi:hypothetical protein
MIGILKDHEDDGSPKTPMHIPPPPPTQPEPTIADAIYNEKIDTAAMTKYTPLIPLPPEKRKGLSEIMNEVDCRHFEEWQEGSHQ